METNFTPWNDQLEIDADDREDIDGNSFEDNLTTPEEIAEFEAWLDEEPNERYCRQ